MVTAFVKQSITGGMPSNVFIQTFSKQPPYNQPKRPRGKPCSARAFFTVKKAHAFLTKGCVSTARKLFARCAKSSHLRDEQNVSGRQSRRITWLPILFRPAGRNSTRLLSGYSQSFWGYFPSFFRRWMASFTFGRSSLYVTPYHASIHGSTRTQAVSSAS